MFKIHERSKFINTVYPLFFPRSSPSKLVFASAAHRLRNWGFQRVRKGLDAGAYFHPLFKRNCPHLLQKMKWKPAQSKVHAKQESKSRAVGHQRGPVEQRRPTTSVTKQREKLTSIGRLGPTSLAAGQIEKKASMDFKTTMSRKEQEVQPEKSSVDNSLPLEGSRMASQVASTEEALPATTALTPVPQLLSSPPSCHALPLQSSSHHVAPSMAAESVPVISSIGTAVSPLAVVQELLIQENRRLKSQLLLGQSMHAPVTTSTPFSQYLQMQRRLQQELHSRTPESLTSTTLQPQTTTTSRTPAALVLTETTTAAPRDQYRVIATSAGDRLHVPGQLPASTICVPNCSRTIHLEHSSIHKMASQDSTLGAAQQQHHAGFSAGGQAVTFVTLPPNYPGSPSLHLNERSLASTRGLILSGRPPPQTNESLSQTGKMPTFRFI